jgi:hypothetical protein
MPDFTVMVYAAVDVLLNELRKLNAVIVLQNDFNSALAVTNPNLAFGGNPVTATATINNAIAFVGTPFTNTITYDNVGSAFDDAPVTDNLDPLLSGDSAPNFPAFYQATQNASTIYQYVRAQVLQRTYSWYLRDSIMNGLGSLRETNDWLLIKQALTFVQDMKRINLPQERATQVTVLAQQLQNYYGNSNAERGGLAANQWLSQINSVTYTARWTVACASDTNGLLVAAGGLEAALDAWRQSYSAPLPELLNATPLGSDGWSPGCPSCL